MPTSIRATLLGALFLLAMVAPTTVRGADGDCPLLTTENVARLTSQEVSPGPAGTSATNMTCRFGLPSYEINVVTAGFRGSFESFEAQFPAPAGAERIPDLGDSAWWISCADCGYSTNWLTLLSDGEQLTISFDPVTEKAGLASTSVGRQHRAWAIELARLALAHMTPATPTVVATPVGVPAPAAPPSAASVAVPGPAERTSPQASTTFADSVPSPAAVSSDPIILLQSAVLALLLVVLMPFPGQLFNSTLEAHEDEVRHWFRLDRGRPAQASGRFWGSWPGVVAFLLLATLLYALLDPTFGLTVRSLPTFIGMLAGIVVVTLVFALPSWVAHRRSHDAARLKVVPISLLIGVACVLISRLVGFQPGYLYGLLMGLTFARELSTTDEGRAAAMGAALMLVVSLVAWLGLGALTASSEPDFGLTVLRTVLAALMVAGLEGAVFGLLPMRFLPGLAVYEWHRGLWALLLGLGAFAFFHILVNPASGYLSDGSRTPLLTSLGLLFGFGLVSIAFWANFRLRHDEPVATTESQ